MTRKYINPHKFSWKLHKTIVEKRIAEKQLLFPGRRICVYTYIGIEPEREAKANKSTGHVPRTPPNKSSSDKSEINYENQFHHTYKPLNSVFKYGSHDKERNACKSAEEIKGIHMEEEDSYNKSLGIIEDEKTNIDDFDETGSVYGDVLDIDEYPSLEKIKVVQITGENILYEKIEKVYQYTKIDHDAKEISSTRLGISSFMTTYNDCIDEMNIKLKDTKLEVDQLLSIRVQLIDKLRNQIDKINQLINVKINDQKIIADGLPSKVHHKENMVKEITRINIESIIPRKTYDLPNYDDLDDQLSDEGKYDDNMINNMVLSDLNNID